MEIPEYLQPGSVLRLFVKDTNPPKTKRFIIVGISTDEISIASVYINSKLNKKAAWSIELESLNIFFEKEGRPYLDHNSWIDCSDLIIRDISEIQIIIQNRPAAVIGNVSGEDLSLIRQTLNWAHTIKGKTKKKFGLFDSLR